jgi:hypothetical protein
MVGDHCPRRRSLGGCHGLSATPFSPKNTNGAQPSVACAPSRFLPSCEGLSRGLIEGTDLQLHSFTGLTGGRISISARYLRCKLLKKMMICSQPCEFKRSGRALLGGLNGSERNRIASGWPGFWPRRHFDFRFHLYCDKTGRKKMQKLNRLLKKAWFRAKFPKAYLRGRSPRLCCIAYTGDKSPAYRPNDIFSKL